MMLRNAAIFMSGNVIAQAIMLVAIPLLARIYSPSDFGVFGLFTTILSVLGGIGCLRYELAVMLPRRGKEAAQVFAAGVVVALTISMLALVVVIVARHQIASMLKAPGLATMLWWLPLSLLGFSLYQLLNYWATRNDRFRTLSLSQVARAASVTATQLAAAPVLGGAGLVVGQLIGQWSANFLLMRSILKDHVALIASGFRLARLLKQARRYMTFPKHSAPQALLNSTSQALPVIMLAWYFSPAVVGLYVMANRVVGAPLTLISQALRQAMFPHFSRRLHSGKTLAPLLWRCTSGLALIGLPVVFVFTFFGVDVFRLVLGDKWAEAGGYAAWIVLWLWAGMVNPAASVVLTVLEKQGVQAIYEMFLLVARMGALSSALWTNSASVTIAAFSMVGLVFNVTLVGVATFFARRYDEHVYRSVGRV